MNAENSRNRPVRLLEQLVAIDSVNPVYGGPGEAALQAFVVEWLTDRGIDFRLQEVAEGRCNVVCRIGEASEPAVALEAHMDTVGVGGWANGNPFALTEQHGRFYGRGACDTKASLACFLLTLAYFHERPEELGRPLLFAATVDEESEQKGAYALAGLRDELGIGWAITGEPTRSRIVRRHKGVCRYEIVCEGVAAHGSTPELGENAIFRMARICRELEDLSLGLGEREVERAIERGSLNVGVIRGGAGFNVVPDRCVVEIDRRLGVGESVEAASEQIRNIVKGVRGAFYRGFLERPPLAGDASGSFARGLLDAAESIGETSEEIEVAYMTNAVAYEEAGIPSLVFGPGDIAQAHRVDEFIAAGELERSLSILKRFFAVR